MRKRIGIVFGCFIPLHRGHEFLINKALSENDSIILAVSGFETDRGQGFLTFSERCVLIKNMYVSNPHVKVVFVDDNKLGLTGTFSVDAWARWCEELFRQSSYNPRNTNYIFTWYTGEQSYIDKLQQLYETHCFELVNRQEIEISGTLIRENACKYSEYINPIFYTYLKTNNRLRSKQYET